MEENLNQLLTILSDSAIGQWWTEHGLWIALLAPLAYVIICCIDRKKECTFIVI